MSSPTPNKEGRTYARQLNRKMLGKLIVIAGLMFAFGYGLIPVYRSICALTGVNFLTPQDSTVVAPSNTQIDKSRTITVEFDGNSRGAWRFRPTISSVQVHPGEMTQVIYEVVNKEARVMDAQAIPSYAPMQAGAFFKKVECFCFTQQTLGPNEAKEFPVVFYIDPAIPKHVTSILLSYTFFEITKPVVAKPA